MNPVLYIYERHQQPVQDYALKKLTIERPDFVIAVLREHGLLEQVELVRMKLCEPKEDDLFTEIKKLREEIAALRVQLAATKGQPQRWPNVGG